MTGVLLWGTSPELGARLAGHDPVQLDELDARLWELASSGSPPEVAVLGVASGAGLNGAVRRRTWLAAQLGIGAVAFAISEADAARVHQLGAECAAYAQRVGVARVAALAVPGSEDELDAFVSQPERTASPAEPAPPVRTDQVRATVIWAHRRAMLRGRAYAVAGRKLTATVAPIRHRLDLETLEPVPATQLRQGEVGDCDLVLSGPVDAEPYDPVRGQGGLLLIDPVGGQPAGLALTRFALRRGQNVHWQSLQTTAATRARHLGQTPCVLWLTGFSGAGKSTIADAVEVALQDRGHHTYLLDGDNVRHGLNHDLGFTDADRVENIRRVAEVAKLMVDAGLIVLVSFISPFGSEREMARGLFEPGRFFEIHVDTPLAVAEERDPKGLYAKARRGELRNFTGIDSPYEAPQHPELRLDTTALSVPQAAQAVLDLLTERGLLG